MALVAFQRSGFQNNAFQENDSGTVVVGGHFSERDYKRYRRKLEQAARAADSFNESKYIKEVFKIREIIQEIPVSAPVIEAKREIELDKEYFQAIQVELALALNYIEQALARKEFLRIEEEQEEEFILMMM